MAAVTICSDFGAPKIKSDTVPTVPSSIYHEVMGLDAKILVFWMLSFKPTFSLSFFTFIKRLFLFLEVKMLLICVHLFVTSAPGSSVHGILQARILGWVAVSFSKGCFDPWSPALQADSLQSQPLGKLKNTRVGSLSLPKHMFPTQGSNPHYRWILYQLSHKESPRILEWVTYPFSSGSSPPRNQMGVSCTAGGFFF